jgi:flagellar basal body P-ring protein FlgI
VAGAAVAGGTAMVNDLSAGVSSSVVTHSVASPRFKSQATMEEHTRFKLRVEVLMLEIKDHNHKGRQGRLLCR